MLTAHERHRLKGGMLLRTLSTHDWRAYFTYLLGRPVTLAETDQFLTQEAATCNDSQLISLTN